MDTPSRWACRDRVCDCPRRQPALATGVVVQMPIALVLEWTREGAHWALRAESPESALRVQQVVRPFPTRYWLDPSRPLLLLQDLPAEAHGLECTRDDVAVPDLSALALREYLSPDGPRLALTLEWGAEDQRLHIAAGQRVAFVTRPVAAPEVGGRR